jgi:LysR family transcriptional regulator, nod-box dependent transcriptional activator
MGGQKRRGKSLLSIRDIGRTYAPLRVGRGGNVFAREYHDRQLAGTHMQNNNFDLNLIRTLDALLQEKSVTRACISQPAMSGALHRLRDHFNDQLLVRIGRDMELTPLAESLLGPVRNCVVQFQETLATRPRFDPKVSRRAFTVAMSDYGSLVLMPWVLRRLSKDAPHIACHVEPIGDETFGRLEIGELDLLITVESWEVIRRHGAARDLKMRRLFSDDFVCVVDRNHPSVGNTLTIDEYKRLPHMLVRFGLRLDTLVEQAWKLAEWDINIAVTAPSFSEMLFMLPGTEMIATIQRRFAGVLAASLPLKIVESPLKVEALQEILTWHPRSEFDPGCQYLRQVFIEAAKVV